MSTKGGMGWQVAYTATLLAIMVWVVIAILAGITALSFGLYILWRVIV